MDGKDASGRIVSLLNYEPWPEPSDHSRALSYSTQTSQHDSHSSQTSHGTSPSFSPTTPQLERFDSSSSQSNMDTPSPVTPTYPIEPLEPPKTINPYDGCYPTSTYPVLQPGEYTEQTHNASSIGHDTLVEDVCEHVRPTFRSTNLISPSNTIAPKIPQASSKPMTKRNKYPCPHASRFNCTDTFTTSGHAARHGKKHTGEKNILCPHCNKAFTRKDNMKQHQRTHQGRRDSGKFPKERDAMRRERLKSEQQARMGNNTSPTVPDVGTATDDIVTIEGMKDEDRARFLTPFDNSPALRVDTTLSYNRISADLESPSCRLDALAIAASGMSFNPGGTRRNHQSDGCMVH